MRRAFWVLAGLLLFAPQARAQITTEALLDTLQESASWYFWLESNETNGLTRDRSQSGSPCSIASQGFGFSSICVGIERGWIPRDVGRDRVLLTLQTYWNGPQGPDASGMMGYKGLFYHFLDMNTGTRTWDSELSTIDTALLLAGILDAKMFFDRPDPAETQIRALADSIYHRVDWDFMRNGNAGIMMGWKPGTGFAGFGQWIGYNEAMILYILALGSPTHPVPESAWNAWTSGYVWATQYGYQYVLFPPLFGHQYSHCWIDFRSMADAYMRGKGIDYFENSRRATLAQQAYCAANPAGRVGYSDSLWGITASDTPTGYRARGAPPYFNDDGTLNPTAPAGSLPFAPEACISSLRTMWNQHRTRLWNVYGFKDAFNLTVEPDWYDTDFIGIDQGPIVMMIENYRSGSIWARFLSNPDIVQGLVRAGFQATVGVDRPGPVAAATLDAWTEPNPFTRSTTVRFRLPQAGPVRVAVYDVTGREVARLLEAERPAGDHTLRLDGQGLASGVYLIRLESGGRGVTRRCVRIE
jgi:hypothetical protein